MIDGIALLAPPPLPPASPGAQPQAPDADQVARFQSLLHGSGPEARPTALQPTTAPPGDLLGHALQGLGGMDAELRAALTRLEQWPTLRGYLAGGDPLRGFGAAGPFRHVSNLDSLPLAPPLADVRASDGGAPLDQRVEDHVARLAELQERQADLYGAALRYQQDTTSWFLRVEFMLSRIRIVTASVRQAVNGLRTLFTSQ